MGPLLSAGLWVGIGGCDGPEPAREASPTAPSPAPAVEAELGATPAAAPPQSCDELGRRVEGDLDEVVAAHRACSFDVDCVPAAVATRCGHRCAVAIHPAGLTSLAEALRNADDGLCMEFTERDCSASREICFDEIPRCEAGRCGMGPTAAPLRRVQIPDGNALGQSEPPPRPQPSEEERARAQRLLEAVAADDPRLAQDFFFPREAFALVKGIRDPDAYWQRLFARYEADIHALHEELGDLEGAEFVRLHVVRRGGWVPRGGEANALPYWVSRHSRLYYRAQGEERSFEVRVLITWGDRWYITHLSEFH